MGLDARIPVFTVSDKVSLKPVCSAAETSWNIETLREQVKLYMY